ncbi:hypothetical protein [Streptomyces sp. NPDC046332]|uniref:hypothetical protein n=1 Tax=Streptomyces sp. NPDC046332 TaxID=3155133 RepID=UPI0033C0C5C7
MRRFRKSRGEGLRRPPAEYEHSAVAGEALGGPGTDIGGTDVGDGGGGPGNPAGPAQPVAEAEFALLEPVPALLAEPAGRHPAHGGGEPDHRKLGEGPAEQVHELGDPLALAGGRESA